MNLRPYQLDAIDRVREQIRAGNKRLVIHAPTGSGKTVIASSIMDSAIGKGKSVLFMAPRRELITQTAEKLSHFGINPGIIMAGEEPDHAHPIQVASWPTLHARAMKRKSMVLPQSDLLIVDECHLSLSAAQAAIIQTYMDRGCIVLGLTATPARGDGKGLGRIYDEIVTVSTVEELTRQGYLVPVRYFAPSKPDLRKVRTRMGDYDEHQLDEIMDQPHLVGDVVSNWMRIARDRPTVVFGTSIKHSMHLAEEFRHNGITAEHIDGNMTVPERNAILGRVASGETQVVTCALLLGYGWDMPRISCVVMARPTKSIVLYLQAAGRALRPDIGKTDTILIDHAGCVDRIGYVDEQFPWSLDDKTKVQDRLEEQRKKVGQSNPITCHQCKYVYTAQRKCPNCGAEPVRHGKYVDVVEDDLVEITREQKLRARFPDHLRKLFYQEMIGYAAQKNYKPGWAYHKYFERFKEYPDPSWPRQAMNPSPQTLSYVKHLWIKKMYRDKKLRQAAR